MITKLRDSIYHAAWAVALGVSLDAQGSAVDLDGDGLSDVWQIAFEAEALQADGDEDLDGRTNLEECEDGTDPFDTESRFDGYRFEADPAGVAFLFEGVEGQSYSLEVSSDLASWREGEMMVASAAGDQRLVGSVEGSQVRFMRFRVGGDADGDGISDFEEKLLGYDPFDQHSQAGFLGGDMARLMSSFYGEGTFEVAGKQAQGAAPTLAEASRFLTQASLSSRLEEIERVAAMGYDAWIDDQFTKDEGRILPGMYRWIQYFDDTPDPDDNAFYVHRRFAWWEQMFMASDLLRQRMAVALSEIYVVSDSALDGGASTVGMSDFYDMLLEHSFGNWRSILRDTSLHPVMGEYLSHLQNRKADPAENRYPDENYAREVMQLFSIGLFELNADGTRKVDANGNFIPTYDNETITNFARVFTGFSFGGPTNSTEVEWKFRFPDWVWDYPMNVWEHEHDTDAKTLLNGVTLPSFQDDPGRAAMDDFEAAIENLFEHPNVGPFISYRLIQRLVKSNPSPEYVRRVGQVFADNGQGVRGDMKSVVRAILLDVEARSLAAYDDPNAGRLREPYLRWVRLVTSFGAASRDGGKPLIPDYGILEDMGQRIMSSNSVFNFFSPDYVPPGEMADAGLVGPEFQIMNASSTMSTQNVFGGAMMWGFGDWTDEDGDGEYTSSMSFEFTDEIPLLEGGDPEALIERLDLILCHGTMTDGTKQVMRDAYAGRAGWFDARLTVAMLVRIAVLAPEFAVTR